MGVTGCYQLDVTCDIRSCGVGQMFGESTRADCMSAARKAKWWILQDGSDGPGGRHFCLCPKHNTKENRIAAKQRSRRPPP